MYNCVPIVYHGCACAGEERGERGGEWELGTGVPVATTPVSLYTAVQDAVRVQTMLDSQLQNLRNMIKVMMILCVASTVRKKTIPIS